MQIAGVAGRLGIIIGAMALGFGLVLKGLNPGWATTVLRFGGYAVVGSLIIFVVAGETRFF